MFANTETAMLSNFRRWARRQKTLAQALQSRCYYPPKNGITDAYIHIYIHTCSTAVCLVNHVERMKRQRMKTHIATDWPKCFCIYRLKCSKAISGWMDGRTEISGRPYSKSTCGANKSTCGANKNSNQLTPIEDGIPVGPSLGAVLSKFCYVVLVRSK